MARPPIRRLDTDEGVPAGTRLGPYEIVSLLGAGGMGEVYRARDTRLSREVAIKVLSGREATLPRQRRRFEREAQLASAVNHPHVLTVYDVGSWQDLPYVVTELLEGETLRARLRPGRLAWREAVDFAVQIARGLEALHARGIVHRDLKPENLFVTTDGRVKILDLGLAGASAEAEAGVERAWDVLTTQGAAAAGTAAYMSPEQVRRAPVDARSDLFACGVVLYETLSGRRPFHEETAVETMTAILRAEPMALLEREPSLPPGLARIVHRCLEKRPESRFHSAHDLALALEASVTSAPTPAHDPAPRKPEVDRRPEGEGAFGSRPRVRPGLVFVGAAVLATGLLGLWPQALTLLKGAPKAAAALKDPPPPQGAALHAYDAAAKRFAPYLEGLAAEGVVFSPDGSGIVYTSYPEGQLWFVRADRTARRPLGPSSVRAALPRFSPDGRLVAYAGRTGNGPWKVHVVSTDGGRHEVLPPDHVTDPGWSADGRFVILGRVFGEGPTSIFTWDLETRRLETLRESEGLFSPRPSPDGRYLAALRQDDQSLALRGEASGGWRRLTDGAVTYPEWTKDGAWLHFRHSDGAGGFSRVDPRTGREEPVAEMPALTLAANEWGAWSGLTPQGAPLLLVDLHPAEAARRKAEVVVRSSVGVAPHVTP